MFQYQVSAANCTVDTQLSENGFILGITQPGYSTRYIEHVFGYLAGHQIILIPVGHSNKHISPSRASFLENSRLTTVPSQADAAQLIINAVALSPVFFQYQNLVTLSQQRL